MCLQKSSANQRPEQFDFERLIIAPGVEFAVQEIFGLGTGGDIYFHWLIHITVISKAELVDSHPVGTLSPVCFSLLVLARWHS